MLFTIIIFIEAGCLLSALFLFKKQPGWWKNFAWFLLLTLGVEVSAYIQYFVEGHQNHWIYNLYLPIEMTFLFYLLFRICKPYLSIGPLLLIAFIVFIGLYSYESTLTKWQDYSSNANTLASVVIIFMCFLYFYFLLGRESYIEITKDASFWVMSGLFIFYLGSIGCSLFQNQLVEVYKKTGVPIRYIIMLVLNFILYSCWTFSFICNYRRKISSS